MRLRGFSIVIAVILYSLPGGGCNESSKDSGLITLKFNLQPGSTYQYIMDSRLSLQPEVNGATFTITQEMKIVSLYEVISSGNNSKNIAVTYDRITMNSGNGITTKEYDSNDTTNKDPLFRSVGMLVNKPFGISVSDNGMITNVRGFEGNNVNDSSNMSAQLLGDSSIRKMMMQCLYIYPDAPVKKGDSWKRTFNASTGFIHMQVKNTYTLSAIDKGTAYIDVLSKITPEDTTGPMLFSGMQSGKMEVNIASGQITRGSIGQQLEGTIKMGGAVNPVKATSEINIFGNKE